MLWVSDRSSWSSEPGVYSFLDKNDKILYIGKAKNLKNRLTNYTHYSQLSPRIKKLVTTANKLKFEVLESELEALLIEAELIHTHQPFFNIRLKDDKSPIYLVITKEKYPRVLRKRKTDLIKENPKGTILGPFQSSYKINEVLKIARKIFPWCNKPLVEKPENKKPTNSKPQKACFYYHLDQCPGACLGIIDSAEYLENIENLKLFLRGKKGAVLKQLKNKMSLLSNKQKYEKAQLIKLQIQNIKEVTKKTYRLRPNLVLPGFGASQQEQGIIELQKILITYTHWPKNKKLERIEGYDVSNIQGKNAAVSMVVSENGKPNTDQYRLFNIDSIDTPNDYKMMKEALTRRQNHPEWGRPDLIIVDGGKGQIRSVLQTWSWRNPVIGIAKNPDRLIIPLPEGNSEKYKILTLTADHPALKIAQQLRDESHRFAKKQWGRRHVRGMLNK
ncbi:MAG: GIY-YIG nuclease family protein [Candidatus Pacebacteria bacterium]|jgi:excinuclease ABC subunit C|nr:GIY-YIG nuclease family protein [Candidatus Paceibacterota bacterium]MBT4652276.1 GIY-YIG nuclease family protein [Candidatus Paceibacterota bacterium]MBT6756469.1 GIY-YIG nuclease family protein [Candidatus Paceibacterota bacterium]MBT6920918.1 GIY-YIG nuclease family protein [Candidatus Paceibacterota bacterium]